MEKKQWTTFGIGFMVMSFFLFKMASPYCDAMLLERELLTSCYIRRYAFSIPAILTMFLSLMFMICSQWGDINANSKKR